MVAGGVSGRSLVLVAVAVSVAVAEAGCMLAMTARQPSLHLGLPARCRALHGDRQRAPNGEQHGEQQEEPEAKRLHGTSLL